ncbi:MAG: AAA family ATPase [Saprospiraceae bacterium]|nr:AAA family ATPase [Saprospiraceae bacterium]MBP7679779.1 AAA family ATPase [Saprospiraceae bacterium]
MQADLFYKALHKHIADKQLQPLRYRIEQLYELFQKVYAEAASKEQLYFSSLFTRIAFVGHKFELNNLTLYNAHHFRTARKKITPNTTEPELQALWNDGVWAIAESVSDIYKTPISDELKQVLPKKNARKPTKTITKKRIKSMRVVALADDADKQQITARKVDAPDEELVIQYGISDKNELFDGTIQSIRKVFGFPVLINLLDISIDEKGIYSPVGIVVEPDFLVDVTAVAEVFQQQAIYPILNIVRRTTANRNSLKVVEGNVVNFFLDEIIANPNITFDEIKRHIFKISPLDLLQLDDSQAKTFLAGCKGHFARLKNVILNEFAQQGIERQYCYLEPSFYSEKYGLQGRLDILHHPPHTRKNAAIVELKSGKVFNPNRYQINQNHYIQTLLYDLLIEAAFGDEIDPANYILYSQEKERNLRFAPVTKIQQYEAIEARNQLVAIERSIANIRATELDKQHFFDIINTKRYPKISGFHRSDLQTFEKNFAAATLILRKYFTAFAGFVAREHLLAKIGIEDSDQLNGNASLWRNTLKEKEDAYAILFRLKIIDNQSNKQDAIIIFERTTFTNPLANFRQSDVVVLYPYDENNPTPLQHQLFKCTIVAIDTRRITVRLRAKQTNQTLFVQHEFWNIEPDFVDSSFNDMYRNLFLLLSANELIQQRLLTQVSPTQVESNIIETDVTNYMTEKQRIIFNKMMAAEDYFLLWGPPGTGKTSVMLRAAVAHWLYATNDNILLLAYTNRAVDEICEAIESLGGDIRQQYFRIGSRFATDERFRDQLFDQKIAAVHTRKALSEIIQQHRIVVATVASINGKKELLHLKKFHRIIIDEASQILEPMLVGLLAQFQHFILIGDHRQLPAVVAQPVAASEVKDEHLSPLGLTNMRNSLFERMYKQAVKKNWHWAYDHLSEQGRMHEAIMRFPAGEFYDDALTILPDASPYAVAQSEALPEHENELHCKRLLYIPTQVDFHSPTGKTNSFEAAVIAQIVQQIFQKFETDNVPITKSTIGIITPYRAQIAQIKNTLTQQGIDTDLLTVDTVERYQGGARDIIILSVCVNNPTQFSSLITASDDGKDRKLNVALTRARQQVIMVGNEQLLSQNITYRKFIATCEKLSLTPLLP